MTEENKKAIEAIKELSKKALEDAIEELKHPKFKKMAVGYMFFDSEHAKNRRRGRSDANE